MSMYTYFSRHKKSGILLIVITPICVSFLLSVCLGYRILINTSTSLPHIFYITNPKQTVYKRGDYIAFTHVASPQTIVKRVIGVEGDEIVKKPDAVYIKNFLRTIPLGEKRSDGTRLTPIVVDVIPAKTVFVAGSHHGSFDSRYEEFGLIPLAHVRGQVWPIF